MSKRNLKKCSTKEMSLTQAAWLAGFFDGEGSITNYFSGKDRKYKCWCLTIPNTDKEALDTCLLFTGVGNIISKKQYKEHYKIYR